MKGPREMKRWIAKTRSRFGKTNGVIGSWAFDDLRLFKLETDRKFRKTKRRARDGSAIQSDDFEQRQDD